MPTNDFFVTVERASRMPGSSLVHRTPQSVSHAKTMGTTVTLCGAICTLWPKIWDQPYLAGDAPDACRDCDSVLGVAASTRDATTASGN
jgi:hypothetical protein